MLSAELNKFYSQNAAELTQNKYNVNNLRFQKQYCIFYESNSTYY